MQIRKGLESNSNKIYIHTKKLDILAKYPDILAFTIKNLPYIILTNHIWFS